jgi:hypothetical protein
MMSRFLNFIEAPSPVRPAPWAEPAPHERQARQGLLISPETTLRNKAVADGRKTFCWLGIGMILTAFALIISLIFLASS